MLLQDTSTTSHRLISLIQRRMNNEADITIWFICEVWTKINRPHLNQKDQGTKKKRLHWSRYKNNRDKIWILYISQQKKERDWMINSILKCEGTEVKSSPGKHVAVYFKKVILDEHQKIWPPSRLIFFLVAFLRPVRRNSLNATGSVHRIHFQERAQHIFSREHMTAHSVAQVVRCEKSASFILPRTHLVFDVVARHPVCSFSVTTLVTQCLIIKGLNVISESNKKLGQQPQRAHSLECVWPNGSQPQTQSGTRVSRSFETSCSSSEMRPRMQRSTSRWYFHRDDVMSTADMAEKTEKVTTNVASEGASRIGCKQREARRRVELTVTFAHIAAYPLSTRTNKTHSH